MNKKTIIFYFSQSGNSLYSAKKIAERLGNTTLISIPEAIHNNKYKYNNYEKVGFILPLYYMSMPNMVRDFISKIEISKDSYVFSVITRASSKGRIFEDINNLLHKKDVEINYGKYISFPDSYIKWSEAPNEEKILKILKEADNTLNSITEKILSEDNYVEKEGIILKSSSLVVYKIWKSRLKTMGKKFKVNSSCIGCGICEKTCPARNITLDNGKPIWSNKCEDCMACVQHCPKKAIYFNSKTIGKERYIHPKIKLNELLRHKM